MATAAIVVGAGVLISLIDGEEYPNVWIGMWYALQTVTTVGTATSRRLSWAAGSWASC